jgi:SulP family sulfate permease
MAILKRLFPFLAWFERYNRAVLRADLVAGITVALVLIPQSMAYAQLAGLPAYYGLYAAFLPPMVASLFGSSHQLATGPVAIVSLMTAAALEPLAAAGSIEYVAYAIMLALFVGLFQLALGVLRLGLIVNFLSHPVVNGFTNAAALIIATSQLSKIFGVYVDEAEHHYGTVVRVIQAAVDYTHWPTVGMAVLAFIIMVGLKKLNPRIPNVLAAVVVTTFLSWTTDFEKKEQVSLSSLESEQARQLVTSFNETVAEREEIESLRSEGNRGFQRWGEAVAEDEGVCTYCHASRGTEFVRADTDTLELRSGMALALHHTAGVLELRLTQLRERESSIRAAIRAYRFELVDGSDGSLHFFETGERPDAGVSGSGTWRVRIGVTPLDEQNIVLTSGGAVVATIPEGLPKLAVPTVNWAVGSRLFVAAVVISVIGFMEAISIAKAMAARTQQRLNPDQELIGQGLANIIGCMGQSYAVSGSFSRSAVNLQGGAKTGMSNVFSSGIVVIVLLFFTRFLYHLPQAVLAAIIIVAVVGLLNVSGFIHAWKAQKFDGFSGIATFVVTLGAAPHLGWGIALGVALSLGAYLYRTMRPPVPELSLHPDGSLRDARRHNLQKCRHIAAIRFDGPLNFANTAYLEDKVLEMVAEMPELKHVLIAAHAINEIDASGEDMLRLLVERLREAGYGVSFSGIKEEVQDALMRTGLYERIGEENMYPTQALAVAAIYAQAHMDSTERDCPLRVMRPRVMELSLYPDGSMRDAERLGLDRCEYIAVVRFDGSLDRASSEYLGEKVNEVLSQRTSLRHLLIAAHGVNRIDAHGVDCLERLVSRLRQVGVGVSFSGFTDIELDFLKAYEFDGFVGPANIYQTPILAIRNLYAVTHLGSTEKKCPLEPLRPYVAELSLHSDGSFRDSHRRGLKKCQYVSVLRYDGPLDMAASEVLERKVEECIATMPKLREVLFAAHRIIQVDTHGAARLGRVVKRLKQAGYDVSVSGVSDEVADVLKVTLQELVGEANVYPTQAVAIESIHARAHEGADEDECPLIQVVPQSCE